MNSAKGVFELATFERSVEHHSRKEKVCKVSQVGMDCFALLALVRQGGASEQGPALNSTSGLEASSSPRPGLVTPGQPGELDVELDIERELVRLHLTSDLNSGRRPGRRASLASLGSEAVSAASETAPFGLGPSGKMHWMTSCLGSPPASGTI